MPGLPNTREKILLGARRCFANRGFVGATVPELENACGATRRTLFKHFSDKQQLFVAVLEEEVARRSRYFEGVAAALEPPATLREILAQLFAAQLKLTRGDPSAIRLRLEFIRMGELEPDLRPHVDRMESAQLRWRGQLFARLAEQGLLHADWSAEAATDLMSTMLLGVVAQQSYEIPTNGEPDEVARGLALCLSHSLQQPPASKPSS